MIRIFTYRQNRRGSLAIFFCLVMTVAVLYIGIFVESAKRRSDECDLASAMTAQIQTCLASYDNAWRPFGLFGFMSDTPDRASFYNSLPRNLQISDLKLVPQKPLSDAKELDRQILRYMKCRVPAILAAELIERLRCCGNVDGEQSLKDTGNSVMLAREILNESPESELPELIRAFCGQIVKSDLESAAGSLFREAWDAAGSEMVESLESAYRQHAVDCIGIPYDNALSSALGGMPDYLDPSTIGSLASKLETALDFKTAPVYDKICIVEYVLGQFRPAVGKMVLSSGTINLETIGGRSFHSFPDTRKNEVEQIVTGHKDPLTAARIIKYVISGLRTLVHLAAILCDEKQMAVLKGHAALISAVVAAASSGAAIIDPQIALYLVVAGKAIQSGTEDYKKLAAGQPVALWPGQAGKIISLYYQDYLRLFLHLVKHETLLSRIAGQLEIILPGERFTVLSVQVVYKKKTYCLTGGYYESPALP